MHDIQSMADDRGVALDRVGVRDLRYPIVVLEKSGGRQQTTARISLAVSLPHNVRGTHMSRFLEVLNDHQGELTARTLPIILGDLQSRLVAESAEIEADFPFFLGRSAPVSGATALLDYDCRFLGRCRGNALAFTLVVRVPVTTLCPCSKAISDYGAHNQRGYVSVSVQSAQSGGIIWIEDLIDLVEKKASSPVYPLLKRPDERFVTMRAYDRPAFVEDMVRDVAAGVRAMEGVAWYSVEAVNMESIHNHSAFASVEELVTPVQHIVNVDAATATA